jgi:hypothetical protein
LQRSNWIPASCLLLRHATIRSRMVAWNKHLHACRNRLNHGIQSNLLGLTHGSIDRYRFAVDPSRNALWISIAFVVMIDTHRMHY